MRRAGCLTRQWAGEVNPVQQTPPSQQPASPHAPRGVADLLPAGPRGAWGEVRGAWEGEVRDWVDLSRALRGVLDTLMPVVGDGGGGHLAPTCQEPGAARRLQTLGVREGGQPVGRRRCVANLARLLTRWCQALETVRAVDARE